MTVNFGAVGAGFNGLPIGVVIDVVNRSRRDAGATLRVGFGDSVAHRVIGVFGNGLDCYNTGQCAHIGE